MKKLKAVQCANLGGVSGERWPMRKALELSVVDIYHNAFKNNKLEERLSA